MNKERYPITTLYGLRNKIDPTPDYQPPPAWTRKHKQLLIDTILRGYDIPKMYCGKDSTTTRSTILPWWMANNV
jgi:hypothetical protein